MANTIRLKRVERTAECHDDHIWVWNWHRISKDLEWQKIWASAPY